MTCWKCRADVRLRRDGKLPKHRIPAKPWRPLFGEDRGGTPCPASGTAPDADQ